MLLLIDQKPAPPFLGLILIFSVFFDELSCFYPFLETFKLSEIRQNLVKMQPTLNEFFHQE